MLAVPDADGVKVALQEATPVVAVAERVQVLELKDPVAVPVRAKVTVPPGVVGLPLVSVTVAVQVEAWFTTTVGSQETLVVVECGPAAPTTIC